MKATKYRFEDLDFGVPGVIRALILLFALLVPSAVTSDGQSIISDSIQASMDVGTVATFGRAWKAEEPLVFWVLFAALLVTVGWLLRRSPILLGRGENQASYRSRRGRLWS